MKLKWLFFLGLIFYAVAARSQTVDFTYTTTSGLFCSPQRVIFTQTCSGTPGGFIWDFGNGRSSVHGVDSTEYLSAGIYTVKLIALYADSAIVVTKNIIINPKPSVTLTSNTDIICQPGNITFTANAPPSVVSYEWDFADGSPIQITSTNVVTHSFPAFQDYTVIVKVITEFGCYATAPHVVRVEHFTIEGSPPSATPPNGCIPITAGFSVVNDISAPDFAQTYLWDFGDGTPPVSGTSNTITHLYNVTDSAWPKVTITSAQGCVSTFNFLAAAYGIPPTNTHLSTVPIRDTFCGNEIVYMQATALNANNYYLSYGDGTFENNPLGFGSRKFVDTGWKKIVVTPYFNGCEGPKDSIEVYIQGVIAEFEYSNTCANKNVYSFLNVSDGHISRYEWRFSDDPSIRDSIHFDITHTFPVIGSSITSLLVTDSITGCKDTLDFVIYTAQPVLTSSLMSVCKDSIITYSVNNTYPAGSGYKYYFHVPGNNISNMEDSVLHYYPNTHGTYTDYVIITDGSMETCDDTLYLPAPTVVKGPLIDISAPARVCLNVPVVFTNNSHPFYPADNITTWQWDFWDGTGSDVKDPPPHLYSSPGTFLVSLTATDVTSCIAKKEITVIADPIPEITVYPRRDTICLGRDTAILSAYTIDPFVWVPANFIDCNNCDTIKAYPPATTFYVAEATNLGGCKTRDTSFIRVFAPINLQVLPSSAIGVCPKVPVSFNLNTVGITTWSPPAFLNNTTISNPIAIPDTSVTYQVIVKDSAGCYADTSLVNLTVYPLPKVNAGPDLTLPYGTTFTLSPVYHPSSQTYLWTPSDGLSCNNCPQPNGVATETKNYSIQVTSDKGCKAKDDITIKLTCGALYMPSAFTPGNGGVNDYFYPIGRGYKTIKKFIVYNRYGNVVFERNNFAPNVSSLGWDGSMKGVNTLNTQAFVWFLEGECEQGEQISAKGTVLLLR